MRTASSGTRGGLPGDPCPGRAARAGAVRHGVRQPDRGRLSAGDSRELLQNLRQRQILRAQDVALARHAALAGQPVALGRIADVHHVEPGIDEGRHVAIQEIEHDLAGGRRLHIVIADRRGRVHDHHRAARRAQTPAPPARRETWSACNRPPCPPGSPATVSSPIPPGGMPMQPTVLV